MIKIAFYGESDVGLKRKNNEDSFAVDQAHLFCLVADGMGGASAGELASEIFAKTAAEIISAREGKTTDEAVRLVRKTFSSANERILAHIKDVPKHKGMGCTAELMAFTYDGFVIGHVGDSRIYRFQDGRLEQLTVDHSLVQEQLDQGLITPEEAKNHSMRNIILRAVGIRKGLALDLIKGEVVSGDLFLLCSDGLTDLIEDRIIRKVLSLKGSLKQKTNKLIQLAKAAGGKDNITVVLAEILEL